MVKYISAFIFLFSCSSDEILIRNNPISLTVTPVINYSAMEKIDHSLSKKLIQDLTFTGQYTITEVEHQSEAFNALTGMSGKYYLKGELNKAEFGLSSAYQIPLIIYFPSHYCSLDYSLSIYDVRTKKVVFLKTFKLKSRRFISVRFFGYNEHDPDLILSSRLKNDVMLNAINELSEEVVEYIIGTLK
mgnify:CR=1 FL=1